MLGDLNDPREAQAAATAPLRPPFSVDLLARLPHKDRWSHHDAWAHGYGQPNAMLASPALAQAFPDAVPDILREGLGLEAHRHTGPHLADVGHHRPHASDQAARRPSKARPVILWTLSSSLPLSARMDQSAVIQTIGHPPQTCRRTSMAAQ